MVSQIKVWHGMYCKNQHIISHVGDKIEVLVWSVLQKLIKFTFSHRKYCRNKLRLEWRAESRFVHGMYCKNQHMICHPGDKINVSVWKVLQKLASFESVGVAFEPTGDVFDAPHIPHSTKEIMKNVGKSMHFE